MTRYRLVLTLMASMSVLLLIGFILRLSNGTSGKEKVTGRLGKKEIRVVGTTSRSINSDDAFFVYDNGSETDPFQGDQSFGLGNKTGVNFSVMTACPNATDDFLYIGGRNQDREQFLLAKGKLLDNPNRSWINRVCEFDLHNGEMRVKVIAIVGCDVQASHEWVSQVDGMVDEIWKLDGAGGQPVLLERTERWHYV